jgi:hypothetical protein
MWRGATWVNYNYLVVLGLQLHDYHQKAAQIQQKTICFVEKYYRQFGVLFEFYDAKDLQPPSECDRKGQWQNQYNIRKKIDSIRDYHWTAALVAHMLLSDHNPKNAIYT